MIKMKNVLRICSQEDPVTLDPAQSGEPFSSAVIFLLFRGLTRLSPTQYIECDLASSFSVFNDNKRYVFSLGEHYWSDGNLITAHDFVYSWKRALAPGFPLRATNFFYYIKNAEKVKTGKLPLDKLGIYAEDDFTLVVDLEYPCPYFLELTAFCPMFPISSRAQSHEAHLVCSGAFCLEHWNKKSDLLLKKNPFYSNPSSVRLNGIFIKIESDPKEAFRLFENGELDWIGDPLSPLPVKYLPMFLATKKIKPIMGLTSCWFNTLGFPFNNANLRKAFAISIPRQKILDTLFLPNVRLANRILPSLLEEGEEFPSIQESLTTAKVLFKMALRQMNVKELSITFSFEETDEYYCLAKLLKTQWESLFKIQIQLEPISFKELWQKLPFQQFQLTLFRPFSQYKDQINSLERFEYKNVPRNFSGWESKKYQALLKLYRETALKERRRQLALKAETILLEEMPIAPIYYYHFVYMQQEHVRNLAVSPVGMMHFDRAYLSEVQEESIPDFPSILEESII
jgi:oligopeptide transport system substrate-binding protein